jgi:oligopeptidase B
MYAVDHGNGYFFRSTNNGAPNFRVLRASDTTLGELRWEEWLANRDSAFVEHIDILRNFAVVSERAGGLRRLRVTDLRSNVTHYVEPPEVAYSMYLADNRDSEASTFRFVYSSFVSPHTWYDYDPARRTRIVVKQREIAGFDGSKYEVRRIMAPARDGVQVPVSLMLRRGTRLDGKNPLLLYAYGSFGESMEPYFDREVLSLVDRGFVYAIAHVRGGSEMGPQWYEGGKMLRKQNTFTDFINVAEALVEQGYTSPDRLVANGGSGGGLLMGAVANMRPDLFRAIVADVPFVDLLNTMLDPSLFGVTWSRKEYGNPRDSVEYAYMRSYSPYDNVAKQAYPWMLVTTALNDSQVMYWEPTKWVAKLRAFKTDSNPLYLRVDYVGSHWGSSASNDRLRASAFRYAFMLDAVGLAATKP